MSFLPVGESSFADVEVNNRACRSSSALSIDGVGLLVLELCNPVPESCILFLESCNLVLEGIVLLGGEGVIEE